MGGDDSRASAPSGRVRPDPAAYASSEDAARLIGGARTGRIIRKWLAAAGCAPIPNAGYRVADLCAVLNAHPWPGQFVVTPEHFRTVPTGPGNGPENADLAAVADDAGKTAIERFAGLLDALEAQSEALAAVSAELAARREAEGATGAAILAELRAIRAATEAANARDDARLREAEAAVTAAGAEVARLSAEVAALGTPSAAAADGNPLTDRRRGWLARLLGRA